MTNLDYSKLGGLIPAIIQDDRTKNVLMLGFMNEEAYLKTVETGKVRPLLERSVDRGGLRP